MKIQVPALKEFQLNNGGRLTWRQWGSGPPLIMLHGWSMSSAVFTEVAEQLGRHYQVLCPDLPGHGGSAPALETSVSSYSKVIAEWYQSLELPAVALLGWSLGGQVALQLALDGAILLHRLLLVASTPRFSQSASWSHGLPSAQLKALDRNLGRAYEKTMGDFFNLQFVGEKLSKERYRQILNFAVHSSKLPERNFVQQSLQILSLVDLRQKLADIDLPTQVLHGEIDQIIPVEAGQFLAEQIPGATFERLAAVGHAPFFSKPDDCVARWHKFLQ